MAGRHAERARDGKFSGKPSKLIEKELIQGVSREAPTEQYAKAVFYLVKEVGLNHEDIFGGKEVVESTDYEERDGILGRFKDIVYGKERVKAAEVIHKPSMNVHTFHAYIDLLEQHNEEREREMKKQKMKQNMKGKGFGGV